LFCSIDSNNLDIWMAMEVKTADELVAMLVSQVDMEGVPVEIYPDPDLGWRAYFLSGPQPAQLRAGVEAAVERLRAKYQIKA
jgi:hypothetical protein